MSETGNEKKTGVLIIGGGMAGVSAIVGLRKVDKEVDITLIEPKDYMEIAWASYRSPFDPNIAEKSTFPLDEICSKNNVNQIHQLVSKLTKTNAILDDGQQISFDVCVIATGANTKWPGLGKGLPSKAGKTRQGRMTEMKETGQSILNAKSVLIVGGGLIGVETAGDVAGFAKEAGKSIKVTLVHSGSTLCPEMECRKAAKVVRKNLEALDVNVILNEKCVENAEGELVLEKSGEVLEADEVLMTVGSVPVNDFLKDGGLEGSLNEKGWIKTDDYFRVEGTDGKILAFGDCCTTMSNSGNQLLGNIKVIGKNIKSALGGSKTKSVKFTVAPSVFLATTGPKGGVALAKIFLTQRFLPALKNKTMFIFRAKGELGI